MGAQGEQVAKPLPRATPRGELPGSAFAHLWTDTVAAPQAVSGHGVNDSKSPEQAAHSEHWATAPAGTDAFLPLSHPLPTLPQN